MSATAAKLETYQGKKSTRQIWGYIRTNELVKDLRKHSGKKIRQIRKNDLISFLEYLED